MMPSEPTTEERMEYGHKEHIEYLGQTDSPSLVSTGRSHILSRSDLSVMSARVVQMRNLFEAEVEENIMAMELIFDANLA